MCIRLLDLLCARLGVGLWAGASQWKRTATVRAPGALGVTQPQKPCVCVWSTVLLSPACTDATLFLFQIFAADFLFTHASAPASPVVFWCSCSFHWRLDRVALATHETEALLVQMYINDSFRAFKLFLNSN